jgi:hypothetical protein
MTRPPEHHVEGACVIRLTAQLRGEDKEQFRPPTHTDSGYNWVEVSLFDKPAKAVKLGGMMFWMHYAKRTFRITATSNGSRAIGR